MSILAHNTLSGTAPGQPFVPLIIENADYYPFDPGEREAEWHEASDDEYQKYLDYWGTEEGEGIDFADRVSDFNEHDNRL